jgi:hypothetical protein
MLMFDSGKCHIGKDYSSRAKIVFKISYEISSCAFQVTQS